jgi:hypothetical protein
MSVIPGPAKVAVTSSRHLTICGLMRRAMLAEKLDFVPCLLREDLGSPAITEQKAHGNRDGDCQHHGRGVFGQRVAPQTNGTASPSSMKMAPTSRPLDSRC